MSSAALTETSPPSNALRVSRAATLRSGLHFEVRYAT